LVTNPGQGGAVYFSCNREFKDCSVKFTESTFTKNTAHFEGGAIKWTMVMPEAQLTEQWF